MLVMILVCSGVLITAIWFAMRSAGEGIALSPAVVSFPIILSVVMMWLVYFNWRREHTIAQRIVGHQAAVCPVCRLVLREVNGRQHCLHCGRDWSAADTDRYWTMYATQPLEAWRWRSEQIAASGEHGRVRRQFHRFRDWLARSPTGQAVFMGGMVGGVHAGLGLLFGQSYSTLLRSLPIVFVAAGMMLLIGRERVGDSRHCPACDHQLMPGTDEAAVTRCPECGEMIAPGAVMLGRRVHLPRHRLVGAAMVAIVVVALFGSVATNTAIVTSVLPTSVLITQATGDPTMRDQVWAELKTRTLTPAQKEKLATGLLESRTSDGWMGPNGAAWIEAEIAAGTLPSELVARYFAEMLILTLDGPPAVPVGGELRLRLSAEHAPSASPMAAVRGAYALLGPIRVDGEVLSASEGGVDLPRIVDGYTLSKSAERRTLTGCKAGMHTITWEVWLFHGPRLNDVVWTDDGVPVFPPSVIWSEHRVLEHVVDVRP